MSDVNIADLPPRDGLVRAARAGFEVRESSSGDMPDLFGYMVRFGEWTPIRSAFEGEFMERIAPGAAKRSLEERGDQIKILFNHGQDPSIGEKTLASPNLTEDSNGVRYEGQLFDTSYNRDLLPGLRAGEYGSSFRFAVTSEKYDETPERSEHNPDGIPERTVTEMRLYEGGPVTFPAYEGAEAGARSVSLTDEVFLRGIESDPTRYPELERLFRSWVALDPERVRGLLEGRIAEGSWDGSESRFADAQWKRSCILDKGAEAGDTPKQRYAVPVREPNGEVSRAGCHAAAGGRGISRVDASAEVKAEAARKLIRLYTSELDEEPPDSLKALAGRSDDGKKVSRKHSSGDGFSHSRVGRKGRLTKQSPSWRLRKENKRK